MLHMMRWTPIEIMNAVRECSWFMTEARESHDRHLQRIMTYCIDIRDRGLMIAPKAVWDSTWGFILVISGMSDSKYVKEESRHSVNGWSSWLCGAIVTCRWKVMLIITLSVLEAELYAAI